MKKFIALFSVCLAYNAGAQTEGSSFTSTGRGGATTFATDYQALGINPANLGWSWKFENKKVAIGLNEMSYSLHSEALSKQALRDEFKAMIQNKSATDFTYDEKVQAAKDFADAGLAFNADFSAIGAAFTSDKLGGIAFRINDRFQWYSKLGPTASDLLFLGKTSSYFDSLTVINGNGDTVQVENNNANIDNYSRDSILNGFTNTPQYMSQILDNSVMTMHWYREYNLSYGRKIFEKDSLFALYGGVGIKYLQGLAIMEISAMNNNLTAFSAITPFFDIDYGTAANDNPSTIEQGGGRLPKAVGSGIGYDFGVNAVLFNKLKLGLSYINGGSITWSGNVYTVRDTILTSTDAEGLESYNIAASIQDFTGEDGLLQWDGLEEKVVKLPSTIRFGASYRFGKVAELGVDIIMPGNEEPGSLEGALIGFGGDLNVLPWLKLQAGFVTGGNYGSQVPVGLVITPPSGTYEMGIASRDAVSFFVQNGPTLSLSMGFMRFRF